MSRGMQPEQEVEVPPVTEVEDTETCGKHDWPNSSNAPCEAIGPVWLG